jgi:hypothetical protein
MELSLVGWVKILNLMRGSETMKFRLCRLEFGINCLADIRVLYKAWDRLWTLEGGVPPYSILIYLTIEDRLPGERVSLNFTASTEMLDKFLSILEQDGLKFSRHELIPNFLILCRVEKDRGGLTVIGSSGADEPENEQDS